MKKLLVIMLVLAIGCFLLLTGCGNSQNGNDDNLPSDQNPDVDLHKHEFVLVSQTYPNCTEPGMRHYECSCGETKDEAGNPAFGHNFKVTEKLLPTCLDDGLTKYACSCGETKEEAGDPATGHIYVIEVVPPTCLEAGVIKHVCVCGDSYEEEGEPAVGHNYVTQTLDAPTCSSDGFLLEKCTLCKKYNGMHLPATGEHVYEAGVEASRIARCTTPTCSSIRPAKNDGKYVELLKYTFNESTLEEFYNLHAEISAIVEAAEPYNADLHAYDENSELYGQYLILEAKYEELYSVLEYVVSQYQIAQLEYHLTMNSDSGVQALENFEYMTGLRMDLINDFYVFSEPIYSSMYRDYYYYGMTDPEIRAFILERNTVSDPEYKALYDRNEQIKIEFNALSNPATAVETPILYAEFVENNNKMAQLLGYENYLEYAYENIYDRDYSYQEVSAIADYVKEYLAPLFVIYNNRWKSISSSNLTQEEINQYYNQIADSFFSTYASNKTLNDYIDLMEFGEDCKKQISFSDEFNALFSDGNLFSGNYAGAYVTYIYGVNTPIAYFGAGYNTAFTVAHEFGHYMNEKYSNSM